MATHSSILAWETPWTEEPGGLQSMELLKSWYDSRQTLQTSVLVSSEKDNFCHGY